MKSEKTGLEWFNSCSEAGALEQFRKCCGSSLWTERMAHHRPFTSLQELKRVADETYNGLTAGDWKEAFSHHPKIGDVKSLREKFASTQQWAAGEQSGAHNASEQVLSALAEGNTAYHQKFGYIFIVCATGKSAEEMLGLLKERLPNNPDTELLIATEEQRKIMHLRLEKLLGDHS